MYSYICIFFKLKKTQHPALASVVKWLEQQPAGLIWGQGHMHGLQV